jgi:hypothetical protein
VRAAARRAIGLAVLALPLLLPRLASACAVCSAGRDDETRLAFLLTTLFLSVLPLGIVGGAVWWLVRRSRQLARESGSLPATVAVNRTSSSP